MKDSYKQLHTMMSQWLIVHDFMMINIKKEFTININSESIIIIIDAFNLFKYHKILL